MSGEQSGALDGSLSLEERGMRGSVSGLQTPQEEEDEGMEEDEADEGDDE